VAKDSTSSDLKIKLEGRVGSLYTVYMIHKEHCRTIEKGRVQLGQCVRGRAGASRQRMEISRTCVLESKGDSR